MTQGEAMHETRTVVKDGKTTVTTGELESVFGDFASAGPNRNRSERMSQSNERVPQRFQWKDTSDGPWRNGVCLPVLGDLWQVIAGKGHSSFCDDPWETLGHVIGDAAAFRWLDNDYGWHEEERSSAHTHSQQATEECRMADVRRIQDECCWAVNDPDVNHRANAKMLLSKLDTSRERRDLALQAVRLLAPDRTRGCVCNACLRDIIREAEQKAGG